MISKVFKATQATLFVIPLSDLHKFIVRDRATQVVEEHQVKKKYDKAETSTPDVDLVYDRHAVELVPFNNYPELIQNSIWNYLETPELTDEPAWNVIEAEVLAAVNKFQLPNVLVEVMPFTYAVLDTSPESFVIKLLEKEDGTRLAGLCSYRGKYKTFTLRSEMPKTSVTYKDLVESLRDTFKEMYSKETIAQPQSVEYFMGSFGFEFIQTLAKRLGLPIPEKKDE